MADILWIQLSSGAGYDFTNKKLIGRYQWKKDLAQTLAGVNRYVNHTTIPWSVAIHQVAVARCIERITGDLNEAAAGLIHDAHESVTGDIPTPVSRALDHTAIEQLKEEVQLAIENELNIPEYKRPLENREVVKLGDVAALHVEKQLFMVPDLLPWNYTPPPAHWAQTMYEVISEILDRGEHKDGGEAAFEYEFARLVLESTGPEEG
jgi:hypothetical protein